VTKNLTFLGGLGLGAGIMLLLDPDRGRRRRALLRDHLVRGTHKAGDAIGATSRDVQHRVQGLAAGVRHKVRAEDVPDDVLIERVRARLGRLVSHPRAIDVKAHGGNVVLTGPVLAHERNSLVSQVARVSGVRHVEDYLESHDQPGNIPALQGGRAAGEQYVLWHRSWPPAIRVAAAAIGSALAVYGLSRRDGFGAGTAILGAGVVVRGLTNLEIARLTGLGAGRRAVDVQKTIDIDAPLEQVFNLWREYENFPRFMSHVLEVRSTRVQDQWHWVVEGPAGTPLEFDTTVTEFVPYETIAWKTVGDAAVRHAGSVHFELNSDGSTRVHVRMSYNPPGGAAGHAVASLLGQDVHSRMDDDLLRMKTFIETGRRPHDATQPSGTRTLY